MDTSLHAFVNLDYHSRVDLVGEDAFGFFEDSDCEISGSGAHLEDGVGGLDPGFVDYGLREERVAQDVLAVALVEFDASVRWCGARGAAAFGDFAHCDEGWGMERGQ